MGDTNIKNLLSMLKCHFGAYNIKIDIDSFLTMLSTMRQNDYIEGIIEMLSKKMYKKGYEDALNQTKNINLGTIDSTSYDTIFDIFPEIDKNDYNYIADDYDCDIYINPKELIAVNIILINVGYEFEDANQITLQINRNAHNSFVGKQTNIENPIISCLKTRNIDIIYNTFGHLNMGYLTSTTKIIDGKKYTGVDLIEKMIKMLEYSREKPATIIRPDTDGNKEGD